MMLVWILPHQIRELKLPNGVRRYKRMLLAIGISRTVTLMLVAIYYSGHITVEWTTFIRHVIAVNFLLGSFGWMLLYKRG